MNPNRSTALAEAMYSLLPTKLETWSVIGENVKWHGTQESRPTDAEIQAEVERLDAIYDSQDYARNRRIEYDKLNQFEMQFDDQRDDTTTWVEAINVIKDKYPKE